MNKEKLIKWIKEEIIGCSARREQERENAMRELLAKIERGYFDNSKEVKNKSEAKRISTEKYKHFNHYHELTKDHQIVDFGDGEFIANNDAIPLLKALSEIGLRTRTHHINHSDGHGFFSILVDPHVRFEIRQVNEADRDKYDGMTELLIQWYDIPDKK
ncbi:hypothetical protein [Sporosarcina sp. FSL W7-1283]|uniref:hypothetical protein n=1 Tax=Sporosarcina sp. FSL W7-1283 TaxID=2921560 RepID=UPI0030F5A1BF